jgi:hypothetical protein
MPIPEPVYSVFGLRIASALPLPELPETAGGTGADVTVERRSLAGLPFRDGQRLRRHQDQALLEVPEVARFAVAMDGTRILFDPHDGASARNVRLYLLGSAMGVLLHVRGLLPLHANAVIVDGRAHAFLGHPGAGKSTLAAAFHDRGFALLSDDVCVVSDPAGPCPLVQRGIPRLRLWEDAVARSGRDIGSLEPAYDGWDKYVVPLAGANAEPAPLGGLYLLARGEEAMPSFRPLRGASAAAALIENTYRGQYIADVGDAGRHFAACLALAGRINVVELHRAFDPQAIDAQVDAILAHLRAAA